MNGIFKGGGAKGILYAGAARALVGQGMWFRAVAGSSAGAITATLIAAGLSIEDLGQAVPEALGRIKRNWFGDLIGEPVIRTKGLQAWLEALLVSQVRKLKGSRSVSGPVTFAELYDATGIELHVVCVDVARRQPIVFNSWSTPALSVSGAVISSSAIPLAFRPGRLEVTYGDSESLHVHRLMDGGVWANYPAFVFKDASFRSFHDLPAVAEDSVTIGFVLEYASAAPPAVPTQFLHDWGGYGKDRGALLRGWLRIMPLRVYFLVIVPAVAALQVWWTVDRYGLLFLKDAASDGHLPSFLVGAAGFFDGFFTSFWPGFASLVASLLLIALILALLGATLLDSAVPAMRTLMAVGGNVPYWVGTAPDDNVVRLTVPTGLGTMKFKLKPLVISGYVQQAQSEAEPQLRFILKKT